MLLFHKLSRLMEGTSGAEERGGRAEIVVGRMREGLLDIFGEIIGEERAGGTEGGKVDGNSVSVAEE